MGNIQRYICQIVNGKSDDLRRIGLEPCRPLSGAVCKTEDVARLEALNAELLQFVEDFWEAREKGREDEEWLADAAWDLMEKADRAKEEGVIP